MYRWPTLLLLLFPVFAAAQDKPAAENEAPAAENVAPAAGEEEKAPPTLSEILSNRIVAPDEFTEAELEAFAYQKFKLPPAPLGKDDPLAKPYLDAFEGLGAATAKERIKARRDLEALPLQPRLLRELVRGTEGIEQRVSGREILKSWSEQLVKLPEIEDIETIRKLPLTATKIQALRRIGVQHTEEEQRKIANIIQYHDIHGLPPERRARALDAWFRPLETRQKGTQFLLNHVGRAFPLAADTRDAERVNQALGWIMGKSLSFSEQRLWMTVAWGRHIPPELDRDALFKQTAIGNDASQFGVLTLVRDGHRPAYAKLDGMVSGNSAFLYNMLPMLRFLEGAPPEAREAARDSFANAWMDGMKYFEKNRRSGDPALENTHTHYMNYFMQNLNSLVDQPEVLKALRGWSGGKNHLRLQAVAAQFAYLGGDPAPFRALDRETIDPHLQNSMLRHTHFSQLVGHMKFRLLTAANPEERAAALADLERLAELQLAIIQTYMKQWATLPNDPRLPRHLYHHSVEITGLLFTDLWPLGARPELRPLLDELADFGEGPHRAHNQQLVCALFEATRLEGNGTFEKTVEKWAGPNASAMNALQAEISLASRREQFVDLFSERWADLKSVDNHIVDEGLAKAGTAEQRRERGKTTSFETLYHANNLAQEMYADRHPKWRAILDLRHGHAETLEEAPDLDWRVIRKSVLDLLDREQIDPKQVRESLANWEERLIKHRSARGIPWDESLHEIARLADASGYTFDQEAEHPRVRATSAIVTALVAQRQGDWKTAAANWQKLWPLIPTIGRAAKHPGWKQEELICRWLAGEDKKLLIKEGKELRYPFVPHVPKLWILFLIEQNRHADALTCYRLCEFDACEVDELPPWITLHVAWSAAIVGEFKQAARLAERCIKDGRGGARLAEQAADLYRWSRNPNETFEDYLAARSTMDLEAMAAFAQAEDKALASLVGYQRAVADPTAESFDKFAGTDSTFARLGTDMATATKTKPRCRLTESPLHLETAADRLSPHTLFLCFTAEPGQTPKPFTVLTWFDRRGIPMNIGTTARPHPGHGSVLPLRMSPHFIQPGPRFLLAESPEGDELHAFSVNPLRAE